MGKMFWIRAVVSFVGLIVFSFNLQADTDLQDLLPEMIAIPAGQFEMGCVSKVDCKPREEPVHKVTVASFQLAKTEVTADLWAACVMAKGCDYVPDDNGWIEPDMPVRYVSWDDVHVFLTWLNLETGLNYRLPTEAEWEYAARAGTVTPFHTGTCISSEQANSVGNAFDVAGCEHKGLNRKKALPVASFEANGFGLHDMHGNVWEWVQDCWHQSYDEAPTDGSAWVGTDGECERHVMRGGTWHGSVNYMRSAYRFRYPREIRTGGLGFRLAHSAD
jgi:formylglycine-generating enzyme required for sulfatase activity